VLQRMTSECLGRGCFHMNWSSKSVWAVHSFVFSNTVHWHTVHFMSERGKHDSNF
jgi:hypothetical protein